MPSFAICTAPEKYELTSGVPDTESCVGELASSCTSILSSAARAKRSLPVRNNDDTPSSCVSLLSCHVAFGAMWLAISTVVIALAADPAT